MHDYFSGMLSVRYNGANVPEIVGYNLGKIAGNMGADILEGKAKPQDMPIRYQTEFKVVLNEPVVKELGLTVPEDVAKNVTWVK